MGGVKIKENNRVNADALLANVERVAAETEARITMENSQQFVQPPTVEITTPNGAQLLAKVADWIAGYVVFPQPEWARICALWISQQFVQPPTVEITTPNGAQLLAKVADWIAGYVVFPQPEWARICALWIAHAWLIQGFYTTPRLLFVSPEKRSGKTRAQEVVSALCPNAVNTINVSAAYLFRKLDAAEGERVPTIPEKRSGKTRAQEVVSALCPNAVNTINVSAAYLFRKLDAAEGERVPTIFMDETDALFVGKTENAENIRGIVNGGYRRGATVGRAEIKEKTVVPRDFPVFAPLCMAGIGNMPETIEDRAIICHMKRRVESEHIRSYRERIVERESAVFREQLEVWTDAQIGRLEEYGEQDYPKMPAAIHDRVADVWEPMFIVAQLAGGDWLEWLTDVAPRIVAEQQSDTSSLGELLLADIRDVFDSMRIERIEAKQLVAELNRLEERPWASMGADGGGITTAYVSRTLRDFGVRSSHTVNFNGARARGFMRSDFEDAWARYAPVSRTLRDFGVRSSHTVNFNGARARGFMRSDFEDAWARYAPNKIRNGTD